MSATGLLRRIVRKIIGPQRSPEPKPKKRLSQTLDENIDSTGKTFESWYATKRTEPWLYADLPASTARAVADRFPEQAKGAIDGADRFLAHTFDLLGSGPYKPVDPGRPTVDGYTPIDWYLDPVKGLRFPERVHYRSWNLYEMRPGDADVKHPWELARLQHWAALGQAWRITGDKRYAVEIARQWDDFAEANPTEYGVHWTCTMDVAIRVTNAMLGLALIRDCDAIDDAFWERAMNRLFDHGRFIFANFENHYEVTSNHYLSNITGLWYLATLFAGLPDADVWSAHCRKSLHEETTVQINNDGSDFESAIPYHRLVTELFMGPARQAEFVGAPFDAGYYETLTRMVAFVEGTLRPDGLMPVVGDADDGRLHVLTRPAHWDRHDGRHLFGPASRMLNRPDWAALGGADGGWEAAWWGYGDAQSVAQVSPSDGVNAYPDCGVYVARKGGNYLLVTNGVVGTEGFGNHKHNELLSFEWHVDGEPIIVDPGSYVYTGDPDARNRFRSTASHATLMIDGEEQNETNPEWLFRLIEKGDPVTEQWERQGDQVIFAGRHTGYRRLPEGVTHHRTIRFDQVTGALVIEDRLEGAGGHQLLWSFPLAPGVAARVTGATTVELTVGDRRIALELPTQEVTLEKGWYAPSYGVRRPSTTVTLRERVVINEPLVRTFLLKPETKGAR